MKALFRLQLGSAGAKMALSPCRWGASWCCCFFPAVGRGRRHWPATQSSLRLSWLPGGLGLLVLLVGSGLVPGHGGQTLAGAWELEVVAKSDDLRVVTGGAAGPACWVSWCRLALSMSMGNPIDPLCGDGGTCTIWRRPVSEAGGCFRGAGADALQGSRSEAFPQGKGAGSIGLSAGLVLRPVTRSDQWSEIRTFSPEPAWWWRLSWHAWIKRQEL
jgi:hypothetical protein